MAKVKRQKRKGTEATWKGTPVNTGMGPRIGALAEYRGRTRSMRMDRTLAVELERRYPHAGGVTEEKVQTVSRMNAILRAQPRQDCITMHHTGRQRVTLWHDPKWTVCYFVLEDFRINTMQRSIEYPSRERAFTLFNQWKSGNGRGILWTNAPVASKLEWNSIMGTLKTVEWERGVVKPER